MKKAKNVILIIAASINFLIFAGFLVLGIIMKIEATANNLALNYASTLEISYATTRKYIDLIGIALLAYGIICGLYGSYILFARHKARPVPYTIGIILGLIKGLDLLSIIGYGVGIVSYRNGDELTY